MPDLPTFLTASCLISLAWLSNRETSEILPPIKPILTICPLTVPATIRMTLDCLAKPLRKPIAQRPIMGPWRNLRHRFNNQSGADLRAGGGPVECDCIICAGGAPNLGCHPQSNDHHTPSAPATNTGPPPTAHELNSAFKNQEIQPYFQPQVSLKDGQITGIEALARWHHPSP